MGESQKSDHDADDAEKASGESPEAVESSSDAGREENSSAPEANQPTEPLSRSFPWPGRSQEIVIASVGGVGTLIAGSVLGGTGSSVESLERWAIIFCALSGLVTWFLPAPESNPKLTRIGSWAAVALVLYWLGPIHIALYRAEHDIAHGTRTEKVAAVERLVRLGDRDLHGADLRELNLSDADLANVRLDGANLNHSMLERALLIESDLSDAKLAGANFRGANLSTANLRGADLGKGSDSARCDRFTQLPTGFACYHGAIVADANAADANAAP